MAELTVEKMYGKALFDAVMEDETVDTVSGDIPGLLKLLADEPDFFELISAPLLSAEEKKRIIKEVFEESLCMELLNLMYVLVDKRRMTFLPGVIREFKKLVNDSVCESSGIVLSASPLLDVQLRKLEERVSEFLNKHVALENKEDPSLIGGMKIFIEDKVIDGSIRKRLDDLSKSLK